MNKNFYKLLAFILLVALGTTSFLRSFKVEAAFGGGTETTGNSGNETSQSSTTVSVNVATANAGDLCVVAASMDNLGTTDGNTSQLTNVTDSQSNTYTKAGEFTNTVGGSAADGATIAVWYSVLTNTLTILVDTFKATYSANVTAKTISMHCFTIASGSTVSVAASSTLANDNADAGSMTISGLTSREYLFYRAIASETDGQGITPTTNYTAFAGRRSGSGGSEKGHIDGEAEFHILTATGDTSDPTMTDTTADRASIYVAFKETAAAATTASPVIVKVIKSKAILYKGKVIIR